MCTKNLDNVIQVTESIRSNMGTGHPLSIGKNIRLVFALMYFPHNKHFVIKRALENHLDLIQGNEFLKPILKHHQ